MIPDIHLAQLTIGIALGLVAGVSAMWHAAEKARAKGFREGFNTCEDRYCDRITRTIRQVRVECGLPADPPAPPAPQPLVNDLMSKWTGTSQASHSTYLKGNGQDPLTADFH